MIDPKTNANQGGPTAIEKACQDLIKAQSGGDPVEIARAFNRVTRATLHDLKLRRNLPPCQGTTPRLEELPEAGAAAADVLVDFPGQSANARYDAADVRSQSHLVAALQQLSTTFRDGDALVTMNMAPLAFGVSQAVRGVYDVVLPVADDDDRLLELTGVMASYLKDPAVKGQDTKHLLAKHKKRITEQVTEQVQSGARQQARDEVKQELTDQFQSWLDKQKK